MVSCWSFWFNDILEFDNIWMIAEFYITKYSEKKKEKHIFAIFPMYLSLTIILLLSSLISRSMRLASLGSLKASVIYIFKKK